MVYTLFFKYLHKECCTFCSRILIKKGAEIKCVLCGSKDTEERISKLSKIFFSNHACNTSDLAKLNIQP